MNCVLSTSWLPAMVLLCTFFLQFCFCGFSIKKNFRENMSTFPEFERFGHDFLLYDDTNAFRFPKLVTP